jgi:hypothetical protein
MERRRILPILFLCSFASLAYEIALTRIFSISLSYHFAFMIVSMAMLGIGASGTVLSLAPRLRNPSYIGIYAFLLGLAISLSYLLANRIPFDPVKLSWSEVELLYVGLYYVALSAPFFFTGILIATAFSSMSETSGLLYAADLLGAGTGSAGVLLLMIFAEPDQAVFIVSCLALSASLVGGRTRLRIVSLLFIFVNLAMLILRPGFADVRMSPYKELPMALRYPGAGHLKTVNTPFSRIDLFRSPVARFAPGLSLRYLDSLPEQIGFAIDGGEINAVTTSHGGKEMAFLEYLPSALPYDLGQKEDVLILDPKGGLQALAAKHYGAKNIFKVESTPSLVEVVRRDLEPFAGGIYSENTWSALGRSWLRSREMRFDLIDISLMGSVPSGSFGIAEDYRYTVEAFHEYLSHLKLEGLLGINLFILPPPRIELRLLSTLIKAMEETGVKDARDRIAAIRSWGSLCILAKKSPFTPGEIDRIKKFSRDRRFDLIYYPGVRQEETNLYVRTPSNEYFHAFKALLDPATQRRYSDQYLFDIVPVRDENPFFHYYLKFRNIKAIYSAMGEKWQYFIEEGYLLPAVFLQALILSLVIVLLPLAAKAKGKNHASRVDGPAFLFRFRRLAFFALVGLGFMFVEVCLIQKMILPLETPPLGFAVVLTSLLISSGMGSLVSSRIPVFRKPTATAMLSLWVVVYSVLLSRFSETVFPFSMPVKIILAVLFLVPLGFFMGIPFPSALRSLGEEDGSMIPWAWSVNGCFSVLGPLMAVMLAMAAGFRFVLWTGAGCYLLAFLIFPGSMKRPAEGDRR